MKTFDYWKVIGVAGALAGLVAWPGTGQAQLDLGGILPPILPAPSPAPSTTVTGQASAVTAVVLGTVTSLANTGTLTDPSDPLGTGQPLGSIAGLLSAESLHAATMGWTDQVASDASLGSLLMTVGGTGVSADFVQSRALAVSGGVPTGLTSIQGLSIGGVSVSPSGLPNERISLGGLSVILNEQIQSASGIVVNALHVRTLDGLTDVVVGSARAGI
jgi:hypothetical protein